MRVAANLGTMFTDVPLLQRYEKAAKIGFKLIEVPFPYSVEAAELRSTADKFNLKHALINAPCGNTDNGERGIAASKGHLKEFENSLHKAIQYAKILECPKIHIMAGIFARDEEALKIYKMNIAFANEMLERESIQLLIEPINPYTIPNYFLSSIPQALNALEGTSNNAKILFDIFHIQQIHGQITTFLKKYGDRIGHIQVAQVPFRHEPDTKGELNYRYIFELMKTINENWTVGCEYYNSTDDEKSVQWVKDFGLEF